MIVMSYFNDFSLLGIHPYLNKDVCDALVELSGFFQKLCAKTLYVTDLERLEE